MACAAPAQDLYVSALFRGRRRYVERTCGRWFILSALHGVVRPEAELEPYDVTLNDASRREREAWVTNVVGQLEADLGELGGFTFEIHAGANYADFGLVKALKAKGCAVLRPTHHMPQGRQLQFYADQDVLARARVAPDAVPPVSSASPSPDAVAAEPEAKHWKEQDARAAMDALAREPALVTACDWPEGVDCQSSAGLYAWWVDEAGAASLAAGLGMGFTPGRIYVGQAGATFWPSGKPGRRDLGGRIGKMHLQGRVRGSTFRLTLASILFHELDVQVQAPNVITPSSEEALTTWMHDHLSVAVCPIDDRDALEALEREVLQRLDPPLNLMHMPPTPLRARLSDLRRRITGTPPSTSRERP